MLIGLLFPPTGTVYLPRGEVQLSSELKLPEGAHDLTIVGDPAGTTLRASDKFHGRAILSCHGCRNITFRNFAIDGNRGALEKPLPLPPTDKDFAGFFNDDGILIEDSDGLTIDHVDCANIAGFAILVNHSHGVQLDHITVRDSGGRNAKGRNNTSGGILLEEGVDSFRVTDSVFRNVLGNAVWTHSRYRAPGNRSGRIAGNQFFDIGRDAIQVGAAANVEVTENRGSHIGFPFDAVDVEGGGTPVGIDTAGNVDHSVYENNRFEEFNGKCIDLDGFHDGTVRGNTCINRGAPEDYPSGNFGIAMNNASIEMHSQNVLIENNEISGTKFGAMFVLGEGHIIRNNRMTRLNTAHCNETHLKFGCLAILGEPGFLESGIYLAKGGERPGPARHISIENNVISGYKMKEHCIEAAPRVKMSESTIKGNQCIDE